jgi:hypothetical protein
MMPDLKDPSIACLRDRHAPNKCIRKYDLSWIAEPTISYTTYTITRIEAKLKYCHLKI